MSLTQRLLALTLAATLPGLIALIYSAIDLRNTRYAEVRTEALRNTQFVVSELDHIFDGVEATLHAVSQAADVRQGDPQACSAYIGRIREKVPALTSLLVANIDGTVRCYSEGTSDANFSDWPYFQNVLKGKKFSIGTYTASRVSRLNAVPVALPVLSGDTVESVVMAGINLDWLNKEISKRDTARGSTIVVTDRDGVIVSRSPAPEKYVGSKITERNAHLINEDKAGVADILSPDGTKRIVGYVPASLTQFGFYVSAGTSRAEAFKSIDRALYASILLFLFGSAIALTLAWLVGEGFIRRPLMRVVATAQAWRQGHDAARTGIVNRDDEIGILGQTFDRLMDENAMREEQRDLAEARREILVHELAHRVKNTLATVQSIASLSFRYGQGPEALRGFQERLQALVRSHDLLTRRHWEHADFQETAEAALAPAREDRAHRITLSGPQANLPPGTVVPVSMILHELCTNSLKYGALSNDSGRITLRWTTGPADNGTRFDIVWTEDGGPPVKPPDHEGFGSRLIASLTQQMNGSAETRYLPAGIVCEMRLVAPAKERRE
jgi:two-component sensor histidine kinase